HPRSLFLYLRRGRAPGGEILVVINMTPALHRALRVGVPGPGFYRELINSDAADYGGSAQGNLGGVHAQAIASHGRSWSVPLTVPPLAALILRREEGTAP